ncbi:MAG: hypothetical protein ABI399_08045 [Bauldia sp.]
MAKNALAAHRQRRKRQGLVRLEVSVRESDAPLIRQVAGELNDPERAAEFRSMLRKQLSPPVPTFKELLERAPIGGIEFDRDRDLPREVEF